MAQCRRFNPEIVSSDAFLEMAPSTQALYFQLGMRADDDGFVSPRAVMRMVGSSEDELKVLIGKRFVLPFETGVIVIKHWRINNRIRLDWYKPTMYTQERDSLYIKENGAYTLDSTQGVKFGTEMLPNRSRSIVKYSIAGNTANADIVEISEEEEIPKTKKDPKTEKAAKYWYSLCKKEIGQEPSGPLSKSMAVIKRANATLSWPQIKQMMDEWFQTQSLEDHEMIQITRCLSAFQVDKFLSENV